MFDQKCPPIAAAVIFVIVFIAVLQLLRAVTA